MEVGGWEIGDGDGSWGMGVYELGDGGWELGDGR